MRWAIERIADRTRDFANRIKGGLVAAPAKLFSNGKVNVMNDINWGGDPGATEGSVKFEANVQGMSPVAFTFKIYAGYSKAHVAAAFVSAWNSVVSDPRFLAVTDNGKVRFPKKPGGVFALNSRKFNTLDLDDEGTPLTLPGFGTLKVNTFED